MSEDKERWPSLAEGDGLENRSSARGREFESPSLLYGTLAER